MRGRLVMVALLVVWCALVHTCAALAQDEAQPTYPRSVLHVRLENEPITPVTLRFVRRALREAEQMQAQCLVIELDTPGGLLNATHGMVREILASRVPVVVYVAPAGVGRAASAGLFITLSSHVAAMAPGTRIGAAHPVQLGRLPTGPPQPVKKNEEAKDGAENEKPAARQPSAPMDEKLVNDTETWARSLADLRGRNAEWAALAVTENRSITATEAVDKGVVDLLAENLDDLLAKIDGREVALPHGSVQFHTSGAVVHPFSMWWGEELLGALANPNIAFLLLMFGFYGILFELHSPGWGVAGTLGVACLVLGFFALSVLPVNFAGLALIALALALFTAEAFVTSFGALTIGGIVCLVLGGLMLIESPTGFMRVSVGVVVPVAVATGLITVFLLTNVVRAYRNRAQTGDEGLIAMRAVAQDDFSPDANHYRGTVFTHGEIWQAVSAGPVGAGQSVEIKDRRGLTLIVEALEVTGQAATAATSVGGPTTSG
jgi:membrane-bound serine protease (ClpP class)